MRIILYLPIICILALPSCSHPTEITQEEMKEIYEQVKTPFKLGQVIFPGDSTLLSDSPGVFRHNGKWYMSRKVSAA